VTIKTTPLKEGDMTENTKILTSESGDETLSIQSLAQWGEGKLAYLKPIKSDDLGRICAFGRQWHADHDHGFT
jgi:hypothetical protein